MAVKDNEIENYYIASVCLTEQIGCKRAKLLLDYFGSGEAIWSAEKEDLEQTGLSPLLVEMLINFKKRNPDCPEQLLEYCQKRKINLCSIKESIYPDILKSINDPPVLLYYKGELKPDEPRVAIVGTRRPTPYGLRVAAQLGEELAETGITIVSGAAYGVDMAAHQGALKTGRTIAILGCGLNIPLPQDRMKILEEVIENGAVISEYSPNTHSTKGTFPHRNRIIAGLSVGVVVIEAGDSSGALNTAQHAANYGRLTFVVPGSIYSEKSRGCHQIIRDGATLIRNADDILNDCKLNIDNSSIKRKVIGLLPLEGIEEIVLKIIPLDVGISIDEILMKLDDIELTELTSILLNLELKEYISTDTLGNYIRKYGNY